MFTALRCPSIKDAGLCGEVLRQADGLTGDVLEVFISLDQVVAEYQEEQRESR